MARLPTFETASVNVVAWPPMRLPVWLFARVSDGAETVLMTCGEVSVNGVPSVKPVNVAVAWLTICCPGASSALIVTSNVDRVGIARPDGAPGRPVARQTEPEHHFPGFRVELARVVSERVGRIRRSPADPPMCRVPGT